MKTKKKILVAPLDWGLGHATRCMPIITELLNQGTEVVIASDGRSYQLLKNEFPDLLHLPLPSYNVSYQGKGSLLLAMAMQVPKFINTIYKEHKSLQRIIRDYKIDAVISDNRYGLWSKKIPCIFLTHQLFIQIPNSISFLSPVTDFINHKFIQKYDECWVPDVEGEGNLSGRLSHKRKIQDISPFFIGALSRLHKIEKAEKKYDLLTVLSGPEPQRTIFEKIILSQIQKVNLSAGRQDLKTLIVRGVTEQNEKTLVNEKVEMVSYLNAKELNEAMNHSELLLSRSGYSTIMDLAVLGKKAILIPTPGQTEQEYLAEELKKRKIFYTQKQKEFDLMKAIEENKKYSGLKINERSKDILKNKISKWLGEIEK